MCEEENGLIKKKKSETFAVNLWSNAEKTQFHDVVWGITVLDMCRHQILFPKKNDFNIEFYKCCEDKVMPRFDVISLL